jgi:hypothetical protein
MLVKEDDPRLFQHRFRSAPVASKPLPATGRETTFFLIVVFFYVRRSAGLRRVVLRQKSKQEGSIHYRDIRRRF